MGEELREAVAFGGFFPAFCDCGSYFGVALYVFYSFLGGAVPQVKSNKASGDLFLFSGSHREHPYEEPAYEVYKMEDF
jgi:hypothetical protein